MTRPSRCLALLLAAAMIGAGSVPAHAYLKFGVNLGGRTVTLKWNDGAVRYFINQRGVTNVTASDFAAAVGRAFATWTDVSTASITYQAGGFTGALPGQDDGLSTLGFMSHPELENVLASTSFLIDAATGELIESDIFFNSAFAWSVASGGMPGRFDLETIAVHEIGHFSGLGHSLLGETEMLATGRRVTSMEAVMFPIAFGPGNIQNRTLRPDDIAGISDVYPTDGFDQRTGSLSGRITKNGQPVYGAHVVAFNPATAALIGNFTLTSDGRFSIGGLTPGPHVLRIEPLDDANIDSFFDTDDDVDIDFRAAFHPRLVVVPEGGDSGSIAIDLQRR